MQAQMIRDSSNVPARGSKCKEIPFGMPKTHVVRHGRLQVPCRKGKNMNTQSQGLAVITGASSGIGAVYAERLARRGYDLLLVARNRERLEHLAKDLAADRQRKVEILNADLTDSKDLEKLERVLEDDTRVTLLVNNAGVGATTPLLKSKIADMRKMITLNVEVLTRLTHAAVPAFVKRGSGTIINFEGLSRLFAQNVRIYAYPMRDADLLDAIMGFSHAGLGMGRNQRLGLSHTTASCTSPRPPLQVSSRKQFPRSHASSQP